MGKIVGFNGDKRRKHHHFLVTITYVDSQSFGRVYTDEERANRFAERQRKSPIVKMARVRLVS